MSIRVLEFQARRAILEDDIEYAVVRVGAAACSTTRKPPRRDGISATLVRSSQVDASALGDESIEGTYAVLRVSEEPLHLIESVGRERLLQGIRDLGVAGQRQINGEFLVRPRVRLGGFFHDSAPLVHDIELGRIVGRGV